MANLGDRAGALLGEVHRQEENLTVDVVRLGDEAERFLDSARKVGESWSGSNLGYHGELFYGDFEKPPLGRRFSVEWGGLNGIPPGWNPHTPEEVKQRIEELAGIRFERIEATSRHVVEEAKKLQTRLLIALAPLYNAEGFKREKELLNELENFDWSDKAHNEYAARELNSFPRMTRDREAIMQGRTLPAHTYYEAVAFQAKAYSETVQRFWRLADRLLKQIQAQMPEIPAPAGSVAEKPQEGYVGGERKKTVFLVHGRAEAAQQTVARFLEKLDLKVVILSEQPSRGRTIIEKFEQHSDVGFVVALLTPDDVGGLADDPTR